MHQDMMAAWGENDEAEVKGTRKQSILPKLLFHLNEVEPLKLTTDAVPTSADSDIRHSGAAIPTPQTPGQVTDPQIQSL